MLTLSFLAVFKTTAYKDCLFKTRVTDLGTSIVVKIGLGAPDPAPNSQIELTPLGDPQRLLMSEVPRYRGTSLIRNRVMPATGHLFEDHRGVETPQCTYGIDYYEQGTAVRGGCVDYCTCVSHCAGVPHPRPTHVGGVALPRHWNPWRVGA